MRYSTLIPALLFLAVCRTAPAVTLAEAIDAAVMKQPGADLADAQLGESRAIAEQASSLFARDPEFALEHFNDGVGSGDGVREWDAGVQAPIWLPGQRATRRAVAQAASAQAQGLSQAQRWTAAQTVRTYLWNVLFARAHAEHAASAATESQRLQTAVERRVQAGDLPRSELLLAQRETLNRERELLRATADRSAAEERWRYVTGFDDVPEDYLEAEAADAVIRDDHPGLARELADFERAKANRDRVRGERRAPPTLKLGARHERGPNGDSWNDALALGVNIPFGLSSQSAPELAASELELLRAGAARDGARRTLVEDLIAVNAELEFARAALDTARQSHQLAEESLRLLQRAFEIGEADLFRLLQVRAQALDAAWDERRLELEVGRDVAARNQALGIVPESPRTAR